MEALHSPGRRSAEYECDLSESLNMSAVHRREDAVAVWKVTNGHGLEKNSKIGG